MAGHDPRARVEGGFQFVAQARREVVGRLVQQEQFRGTGDQQGQGEPSPLADGQLRDRPVEVGCGQQAELRQRYGFGPFGAESFGVDGPRGALRAPEPGVLGQQPYPQAGAVPQLATVVEAPREDGKERGPAGAVAARDQEPVTGGHVEPGKGEPSGHPQVAHGHQRPSAGSGGAVAAGPQAAAHTSGAPVSVRRPSARYSHRSTPISARNRSSWLTTTNAPR